MYARPQTFVRKDVLFLLIEVPGLVEQYRQGHQGWAAPHHRLGFRSVPDQVERGFRFFHEGHEFCFWEPVAGEESGAPGASILLHYQSLLHEGCCGVGELFGFPPVPSAHVFVGGVGECGDLQEIPGAVLRDAKCVGDLGDQFGCAHAWIMWVYDRGGFLVGCLLQVGDEFVHVPFGQCSNGLPVQQFRGVSGL